MQSINMISKLSATIEPYLAQNGFELWNLEYIDRSKILRIFIDKAALPDDGGYEAITLDDCSRVSRIIGDMLDAEELIAGDSGIQGSYHLEVSSPGLDRLLSKPAHYRRYKGQTIAVWLKNSNALEDGTYAPLKHLTATIVEANDEGIELKQLQNSLHVSYENIEKSRLVPVFH